MKRKKTRFVFYNLYSLPVVIITNDVVRIRINLQSHQTSRGLVLCQPLKLLLLYMPSGMGVASDQMAMLSELARMFPTPPSVELVIKLCGYVMM